MELAWLEDFVALAASGQFSHAAESRNISQSGFSRRVKSLEDWVGTPLFLRDPRGVKLTAAGEQFRPFAEDALRKIILARDQALEAARSTTGTLTFASTHALSLTFFPRWLRDLQTAATLSSTVRLVADNMVACERIMLQGQAQFLLCHHHPAASVALKDEHFRSFPLGEDVLTPVCVPDVPGGKKPKYPLPGTPAEPFPHLAYSAESGMGRILAASLPLTGHVLSARPVFASHVAAVLHAMARDGHGVAWLPLSLIADDLASGRLCIAGDEALHIPVQVMLFRARARQSAAAEDFWKALSLSLQATA